MSHKGWSHVGLTTLDMDRTLDFYEGILGFPAVRCDILKVTEGGQIRHVFFDTGGGQLLAFMEPRDIPGVATDYDAGINRGLGVPEGFYHFAFEAGGPAELRAKTVEYEQNATKLQGKMEYLQSMVTKLGVMAGLEQSLPDARVGGVGGVPSAETVANSLARLIPRASCSVETLMQAMRTTAAMAAARA